MKVKLLKNWQKIGWNGNNKHSIGAKAIKILCCEFNSKEFNQVSMCINVINLWNILEVTQKGINEVKEPKINLLSGNINYLKWVIETILKLLQGSLTL